MIQERAITIRIPQRVYDPLDRQLRTVAPKRAKGYPKATIIEGFCKALVIALHRPNPYPLGEMLYRMYLASVRPEDTEGQELIENLFK